MTKTIDDAIALYRAGHSLRDCEKLTGINYRKVEREAKKRGVEKGDLSQLTSSIAKNTAEFVTLSVTEQDSVTKEVAKQLEGMQFYTTHARIVSKIALKSLQADMTPQNAKTTMATLKDGLIVEGIVPFYPNAPTINNTNAQQTVFEPVLRPRLSKEEWIDAFGPK